MTNEVEFAKITPFYIDSNKHHITALEANKLLWDCLECSQREEYYKGTKYCFRGGTAYSIEDQPFFGVDKFGKSCTISNSRTDTTFTEITPEDLPTWLSHGKTLDEFNSWKEVSASLKEQVASSEAAFPTKHKIPYEATQKITKEEDIASLRDTKPSLVLLPRSTWITLRQYEIVRALHRQVESNEVLSVDWIEELLNSVEGERL